MNLDTVIGKSILRIDVRDKVTGHALYPEISATQIRFT
jgi:hypothetical protein